MNFELPQPAKDLSAELREIEQTKGQLSAAAKAKIIEAANKLEDFSAVRDYCVAQIEGAISLRAGLMDSEQRQQEVQRNIKATLSDVARRLQEA